MALEWYEFGAIMFACLFILLMIGIPVGFSLLITAMGSSLFLGQGVKFFADFPGYFFHHLNSFEFTCVPLFILMAVLAQKAGFGEDLFRSLGLWLRRVPGSLNTVSVTACAIFAAISGTSVATAASIGLIAVPILKKYGYEKRLSSGAIAAGGALGILIPPSVPMIMYCIITDQSIGKMFAGGILPGIMTAVIFIGYIMIRCKLKPELAPVISREAVGNISTARSILNVVPLFSIILLILVSMYGGFTTATEAAAVGCIGVGILAIIYRRLNLLQMFKASLDAMRVGAFITLIFLSAIIFGHVAARGGVGAGLSDLVIGLGLSKYAVLLIMLGVMVILGCFMDPVPIILTTMPIFYPIATSFGFNPIFFGVISVMTLETAAITPPVGINLFVLSGIAKDYVKMGDIIRGAFPFVLLYFLAIAIVIMFPDIITYLPNTMTK